MEYYGNLNYKRLMEIATFDKKDIMNEATEIGFIKAKGMLLDYALEWFKNGVATYSRSYFNEECATPTRKAHPSEVPEERRNVIWPDRWKTMKKIKRNKVNYYIGVYTQWGDYGVFAEIPRITNDRDFTWKKNKKYDTLETTIKSDSFEFEIIVKANGNALINVRYTKCENRHRNNVTLAEINVVNASNQDIKDAIKAWKDGVKRDLGL